MSYPTELTMMVEAGVAARLTTQQILDPLIENVARIVAEKASGDRGTRDAMIEIVRNQLDEAVTRYGRLRTS